MAPPRKQVSPAESSQAYQYFRDNWSRRDRFLKDPGRPRKPEKALEKIGDGPWLDDEGAQAMQAWMDRYVTPEGIRRMWTAMRQRKYQLDKQPALVALDRGVHWRLKDLAKRYSVTLSVLVDRLLTEHEALQEGEQLPAEPPARGATPRVLEAPEIPSPKQSGYRAYLVDFILKLKVEEGLNTREIAATLTAQKIKTLGGKDTWKPAMVSRILTEINTAFIDQIRTLPGAMNEQLVWIPELRPIVQKKLKCSPTVFNNAILDLYRQDKVILHRHAHAGRMTAQERKAFVTDGDSWFVGLVLNI